MLIYGVLIFVLVTVGSMALLNWFIPNKSQRRLQELAGTPEKTDWVETVVSVAGPLAKLSIPEGKWEESPLRIRFINAGIRHPQAAHHLLRCQDATAPGVCRCWLISPCRLPARASNATLFCWCC